MSEPEPVPDATRPPLGAWKNVYLVVLAISVVTVLLLALCSEVYG